VLDNKGPAGGGRAAAWLFCLALAISVTFASAPGAAPRAGARAASAALDTANANRPILVGPGNVEDSARQVVRTAAGTVYVFATDDTAQRLGTGPGVVHAWKGNVAGIPTSFSEVDAAHHPVAAGTATNVIVGVDARLDSKGTVHVVYVDETNATLYYRTFSTATDTWGPATAIGSGLFVPDGYFKNLKRSNNEDSIALDANDVPHVVYATPSTIYYRNRSGGTWSAPQTVWNGGMPLHPQLAFGRDGTLHLSWLDNSASPSIDYARLPPAGTWQGREIVNASDVQQNDTGDQGPSIVVTASGAPYVLWISPRGTSGVRIAYRTPSGSWASDTPPTNLYTHAPQIYASGDDVYAFLGHDDQIRLGYARHPAGAPWSAYVPLSTLADGTLDGSASVRWDPLHETDPSVIDALFFDEDKYNDGTFQSQIYYVAVVGDVPPPPPGDTTKPTVALTAPAAGASVGGTVALSANASDDVGVAGVTFQVDGQAVAPEDTAAPYSVSWGSTAVADGTHTITALARDAAGNTGSASLTVTVANGSPPPPSGLVAAYSFDAGSGTVLADQSGNGNNGTMSATTWSTAGKYAGAASFNGSSSLVTIPDSSSLDLKGALTLEAWVQPSALGTSWRTVVFKEQPGGMVYSLYANGRASVPLGQVNIGGEREAGGASQLPVGTWTHLALTYDGASLRLYVNGTLVRTVAQTGSIASSAGALRIGGNTIWSEWFAGLVDDVRVYDRGLSAAEIAADMSTPVGSSPPPPPPPDTTAPTVMVTAPASGSTVSGTIQATADAFDDVAVAGVQFKLDGANLGAEDTSAPYAVTWNTTTAANGAHTLTAVARDAAGNSATSTAVAATVSNIPPPAGLVAAYSFNAGTGTTALDSSGKGNTGTLANATWATGGKYGGALSFNGSSSWVTVPDASSLDLTTGMTLEAWVKPSALGTIWRTVLFKEAPGGIVYSLYANQDTGVPVGQVEIGGGERSATGSAVLALNAWTHLAATYDGANVRLYVNGTLVRTTPTTGSMTASTGVLRIGGNSVWAEWFSGLIDEVRVYNRALTASEIGYDLGTAIG
jgi:hypothetical protein